MSKSLIAKECIAMHTNLILLFILLKYLGFKIEILTVTHYIGQSSFLSFATHTALPLLKLEHPVLSVIYNWLNNFYYEINGKYSITYALLW